jgi:hypothetical protein
MENGIRVLTSTDLNQTTTSKQENYGAVGATADGRRYRYVQAGGAVTAGNVVIAPALVSNHQNNSVAVAAPAGATSLQVTLGSTAATADQYAGGLLVVGTDGSGVPVTLKLRGNTAASSGGTVTYYLEASNPLPFALTTSNVVSPSPSLYNGVTASATAGAPVGVAVASIASGSFGWVQVAGPCGVVNDAAATLSALGRIKQSGTVAGAVVASTAATDNQIGYVIQGTAASKAGLAYLTID